MSVEHPILSDTRERIVTPAEGVKAIEVPFYFQRPADIRLYRRPGTGDAWSPLSEGVDYSIAGAGQNSGGTATLALAGDGARQIRVLGLASAARTSSVVQGGALRGALVDQEFDRQRIIAIEQRRDIDAARAAFDNANSSAAASAEAAAGSATAAAASAAEAAAQISGVYRRVVPFTSTGAALSVPLGASGIEARNVTVYIEGKEQLHSTFSIVGSDLVLPAPPTGAGEAVINGTTAVVEPIGLANLDGELQGLVNGLRRTIRVWDQRWGIVGDAEAEDTAAFNAMIATIPDNAYFPAVVDLGSGSYLIDHLAIAGKNIRFIGDGPQSCRIFFTATSGYAFDVDVTDTDERIFAISGVSFYDVDGQPQTTALRVQGAVHQWIDGLYIACQGGTIEIGDGCVMTMGSNWKLESQGGRSMIAFRSGGGCLVNCFGRMSNDAGYGGPAFLLRGPQVTSLQVSNCAFGGTGPTRSIAISGITSTSVHFVVSATAHGYLAGETIVIRGGANSAYDGCWPIESTTDDTVTILDTRNVGTAGGGGFLEKMHACLAFDNSEGPINETTWAVVCFEGIVDPGTAGKTGSVCVLFDGLGNSSIASHELTSCLYDVGRTCVHIHGKVFPGDDRSITDIHIVAGRMRFTRHAVYLRECAGVSASPRSTYCWRERSAADAAGSAALYIDGHNAQRCRGITLSGNWGREPDYRSDAAADRCPDYGFYAVGDHQDLTFKGGNFYGLVQATWWPDMPADTRITASGNSLHTGAGGEEASAEILVDNGSTVTLPLLAERVFISGPGTIQTLEGGYVGCEVTLIALDGLTLGTSDNVAAGVTLAAGRATKAIWSAALSKFTVH